ncbi:uncharacterized protein [Clytia hemisphaerica]|uniref:uncharacterized protein n=1 Tax=Clytia hemisphaerica TaxID=252671 RepID=UPI0034D3D802
MKFCRISKILKTITNKMAASCSDVLSEIRGQFNSTSNTEELVAAVNEHIQIKKKTIDVKGNPLKFKARIECFLETDEDVANFIKLYNTDTKQTLRTLTPRTPGKGSPYKKILYYRCQHRTRNQSTMNISELSQKKVGRRVQNTNCPFNLSVSLLKSFDQNEPSSIIDIEHNHNHSVSCLQSLTFRDISEETAGKVKQLFERGLTPGLAYRELIQDIKVKSRDDLEFHTNMADRSQMPRRNDFNNLYTQFHREKFGTEDIEAIIYINFSFFYSFTERISCFGNENPDYLIKLQKFNAEDNTPLILCLISPLMQRVHEKVPTAKELVFLDSTSNTEEYNLRVFLLVTHTPIGALPLGIFITSDETTDTLCQLAPPLQALELYTSLLSSHSFGGNGKKGPDIVMTDNCSELRDALSHVWPNSILLFCTFHILQQVWRWLFEKNHSIKSEDRPNIMVEFKKLMYERNETEFSDLFDELLSNEIIYKYPNLISYLNSLREVRENWAHCYRTHLRIRGNNTNNPVEAQFLTLKDTILKRTKEVNINGLFDKLTGAFNDHYKVKLLNVASGNFDGVYTQRFAGKKTQPNPDRIPFLLSQVKEIPGDPRKSSDVS